jgi:hypothetical protein
MFVYLLRFIYSTLRIFEIEEHWPAQKKIEEHWQEEIRKRQQCLRLCTVPVPHSNILPVHLWTIGPLVKFHWSSTGTRGRQLQYSRSENECQKKIKKKGRVSNCNCWHHTRFVPVRCYGHPIIYSAIHKIYIVQHCISQFKTLYPKNDLTLSAHFDLLIW